MFDPLSFNPFFFETGDGVGPPIIIPISRHRGSPINYYKAFKTLRDFRER